MGIYRSNKRETTKNITRFFSVSTYKRKLLFLMYYLYFIINILDKLTP